MTTAQAPTTRSIRQRLVALLVGLGLIAVLVAYINPTSAEARCLNSFHQIVNLTVGGVARAQDDPDSGTCDGDDYYAFTLDDISIDSKCVAIKFRDLNSNGQQVYYTQRTCGETSDWYQDKNDNSRVDFKLCRTPTTSWTLQDCMAYWASYGF